MSSPVLTLPSSTDVRGAAKLMLKREISSVPVVDEHRLVGIVTTSDLLALLGKGLR